MSVAENEDSEVLNDENEVQENATDENDGDTSLEENTSEADQSESDDDSTTESNDDADASHDDESSNTDSDESSSDSDRPTFEPSFVDDILNDHVRAALAPIDGDHPCGESEDAASSVISQIETTGDGIHEALRVAFGEAVRDDNLNGFDMASVGRDADTLVDQIIECLGENCKSLVLASYLPHLMLIGYGPEGFDAGLTIVRELTLQYGGQVFPRDQERLGSFLRRGVYVGNDDKVTDNYKLFLYLSITEQENLPYALLRNAKLKGSGGGIEGRYAADASRSSVDFYVKLLDNGLDKAIDTAKEANQALGGYLNDNSYELVSFTFIESLERMVSIVRNLATENCADYPPADEEVTEASEGAAAAPVAAAQPMTGEIVDREQAIKMLGKIADFFYKTERHSPISYRIRDTIKWCKMDFPELLQLLLDGDESSLSEMQKRVGFDDPDSNSGDED
jgi:type VI secretion system protein ImpA